LNNRNKFYTGIHELRNIGLPEAALEKLADADAFRSIGLERREALWQVTTKDTPQAIFSGQTSADEKNENISLPVMSQSEHVVHDYAATSLSLKAHPVSFVRDRLKQFNILAANELKDANDGDIIKVAGLVL
jgi:error-prone DNA polymerase